MTADPILRLLADVDGTLVDQQKRLTDAAVKAVHKLHEANVLFAITSGRPPKGMEMLIEPLEIQSPIAGFNGGIFVEADMTVIEQKAVRSDLVGHLRSDRIVRPGRVDLSGV